MPVRHNGNEFGGEPANLVAMAQGDGSLVESTLLHSIDSRGVDEEYEFIQFIAAVVRSGLENEGPEYLQTPGGQFWCWLGGIVPEAGWEQAVR